MAVKQRPQVGRVDPMTETERELLTFLQEWSRMIPQPSLDRLLTDGRFFEPQPTLPPGCSYREPRMCFSNSWEISAFRPGLYYVEGYAASIIPVHHAWCIDDAGKVVDVTWQHAEWGLDDQAYFGIIIPESEVMSFMDRTGSYGILFKEWLLGREERQ